MENFGGYDQFNNNRIISKAAGQEVGQTAKLVACRLFSFSSFDASRDAEQAEPEECLRAMLM